MEESILKTIKQMLGYPNACIDYDTDIKVFINSAFSKLHQMGVGPDEGFMIHSNNEVWGDFISNLEEYNMVQEYIYLTVKVKFDPPTSGSVLQTFKEEIQELGWRLYSQGEISQKN